MRCLAVIFVITLALVAVVPTAYGQQSRPVRLAPLPPSEAPDVSRPDESSTVLPGGVLIRGLDAVSEDAVGTLSAADGGLGDGMWDGTGRLTATRLLKELPGAAVSGEARVLARRLLLSIATPPSGDAEKSSLLAVRMASLIAIGASGDAISMANASNSRRVPDPIARSVVEAYFLRGDIEAGCKVLERYEGGYASRFWQKALIVCHISSGKGAEASLGLDLLREEHGDINTVFESIAYAVAEGAAITNMELARAGTADILNLALLTVAEVELPDWILDSDDPAILRGALASDRVAPERKLARAHAALRSGHLSPAEIVAIYETLEADDATLSAALFDPDSVEQDMWLAYLYLAARNQKVAIARSEALWEAWMLSAAADVDDIVMATTALLLGNIPTTADFDWFAAAASRAALLAGEDKLALDWYQLVLRQARAVPEMAEASDKIWPEMRIIGRNPSISIDAGGPNVAYSETASDGTADVPPAPISTSTQSITLEPDAASLPSQEPVPWSPTRLSHWIDLTEKSSDMPDVGTSLYLLQVLGDPVSDQHWARAQIAVSTDATVTIATNAGRMPSSAALAGLARASAAGRRAETALYAVIVLGQAGDNPHAGVVGSVVRGLQRVGLDADAQAIARAALVVRTR